MSTWHQDRAQALSPMPFAHETRWRVFENIPGRMTTCESFDSEVAAYENMMKAPHRYMVAPRTKK